MNKEQYLWMLKNNLNALPPDEIDNVMEYYREYFEDAGVENEAKIIDELGSPVALANKIVSDFMNGSSQQFSGSYNNGMYGNNMYNNSYSQNSPNNVPNKKSSGTTIAIIILTVLSAPIWCPLIIGLGALVFGLLIGMAAIAGGFVIAGISMFFGGLFAAILGIIALFISTPTGIMVLGNGLIATSLGMLTILFDIWVVKQLIRFISFICNKISTAYRNRKERKSNEKVY